MNANALARFQKQAQNSLENLYPGTVTIAGVDYACATRGYGRSEKLTIEGVLVEFDIAFRVRKELLPIPPSEGKRLAWNGREFRIEKVPDRPADPAWYLGCKNV